MHKTTVLLDEDLYQDLRKRAFDTSTTMGEIIRDSVREFLATVKKK